MVKDNVLHIGLDISIVSTGLCIYLDGCFKQYLFVDRDIEDKNKVSNVQYIKYDRILKEEGVNHDILTIFSAENLAKTILETLEHWVKIYKVTEIRAYIEGASYMSKGKYALDIPVFQGIVKRKLLTLVDKRDIKILPPSSLKKSFTGNGRAGKPDMEVSYKQIKELPVLNKRIKSIKSDDVVDATALVWVYINK